MRIVIMLAGVGLLAACGQGASDNAVTANGVAGNETTASDAAGSAPATGGSGSAASEMLRMQPGEWEISMSLPNGGAMPGTRVCLTPEDVSRGAEVLAGGGRRQQEGIDCDYSNVTIAGGRISGTSRCTQAGGVTVSVTMDGTMSPTEYSVNQRISTTVAGQSRDMESRITGRRIGECQAGQRQP